MVIRWRSSLILCVGLLLLSLTGATIAGELDGEPLLTNPSFEEYYTLSTVMYAWPVPDCTGTLLGSSCQCPGLELRW